MRTIAKRATILILVGTMVWGLVACGTNGATSDNAANSQDTSTPAVTEPVDTSSQTEEEEKVALEVELPPVEVFYNKDYDFDGDWTISKEEWEQWCKDHPEDTNKNMTLKDEQEAAQQQQQQQAQVPDTSGNPDPSSEETTKPSTSTPSTSKPSISTPSTSKPSTSTPSTSTPSISTHSSDGDTLTEDEQQIVNDKIDKIESAGGSYDPSTGAIWFPN